MIKFSIGKFITIGPSSFANSESYYTVKFIRTGYGRSSLVIKIAKKNDNEKIVQIDPINTVHKAINKFKLP